MARIKPVVVRRLICAWCGQVIGTTTSDADSHGICPACAEKLLAEAERQRERLTIAAHVV